jgi:hypothetical protein
VNIAFPAFFIFLLVLPGFAFRASFRKTEKTNLDHKPFAEATFISVLIAMVLHLIWVLAASCSTPFFVDYHVAFTLLVGQRGVPLENAVSAAMAHPYAIFTYHFSLLLCAWLAGAGLRSLVFRFKLDQRGFLRSTIRFDTPWYYLFNGIENEAKFNSASPLPDVDGVYISATVPLNKDITFLYTGILKEYFFDNNGLLERLVLTNASRRKIEDDKLIDEPTSETLRACFYPIEGDYLVLRYSEIVTLNIQLIYLEQVVQGIATPS